MLLIALVMVTLGAAQAPASPPPDAQGSARVRGVVVRADNGVPVVHATRVPRRSARPQMGGVHRRNRPVRGPNDMYMVQTSTDGSFVLSNVKPGEYRIDAWPRASIEAIAQSGGVGIKQSGEAAEYASVPLTVGGDDVDGLRVVTTAGHRLVAVVDELVDGEWAEPDYLETLRDQREGPPR